MGTPSSSPNPPADPKRVAEVPVAEASKPRLLFVRSAYGPAVPRFLIQHRDEQLACLKRFFSVVVIDTDFDYRQACDQHTPDLTLFETGLQNAGCRQPVVRNFKPVDGVLRAGFMNADAWGETRHAVLDDLERFELETVFSICVTAGEHMPRLQPHLSYWPNFVDAQVIRRYPVSKDRPVTITGSQHPQYPWRHRVFPKLVDAFPAFVTPHGGYADQQSTSAMLVGEDYARALASAWFAPACGTVARELVRKHIEIPGVGTCLIAERSAILEAAGFVDMQNVVFADAHDVVDKVKSLLSDEARLMRIIDAGHALVHSRHTAAQRTQIVDWVKLRQRGIEAADIVQRDPFGSPTARTNPAETTSHVHGRGHHLELLRAADALFASGRNEQAEHLYTSTLRFVPSLAEPKLRVAFCHLDAGRAPEALRSIVPLVKATLSATRDHTPDPVEWAHLVLTLICLGKLRQAARRATAFEHLRHLELRRVRHLLSVLRGTTAPCDDTARPDDMPSVHDGLAPTRDQWRARVAKILLACGQPHLAACVVAQPRTIQLPSAPSANRVADADHRVLHGARTLSGLDNPLAGQRLIDALLGRRAPSAAGALDVGHQAAHWMRVMADRWPDRAPGLSIVVISGSSSTTTADHAARVARAAGHEVRTQLVGRDLSFAQIDAALAAAPNGLLIVEDFDGSAPAKAAALFHRRVETLILVSTANHPRYQAAIADALRAAQLSWIRGPSAAPGSHSMYATCAVRSSGAGAAVRLDEHVTSD